jgi:hypothetical protein
LNNIQYNGMGCSGIAGIDYGITYNIMAWDIME